MNLNPQPGLVFDEAAHTYHYNGVRLPGVTSILNELVKVEYAGRSCYVSTVNGQVIDAETIESAGDYGRAVHKVMELVLFHPLEDIHYPAAIDPAVKALDLWKKEWKPEIVACEHRGASARYGFAGTLDIYAYIPKLKSLTIVDVKSGPGLLTGPQTAAYERFLREQTGEKKRIRRYKLRVPKKEGGAYQFIEYTDPNDWAYFQSRLFQRQFHQTLK